MIDLHTGEYPELEEAIQTVRNIFEDWEIPHEIERSEEEPFVYLCSTFDGQRRNGGLIVWNREEKKVAYLVFNEEAMIRNEMEGVEDGMGEGIVAPDLDMFLLFMDGTAREVVKEYRKQLVKSEFGPN